MKTKLLFLFAVLLSTVGSWAQDDDMLSTPLTLEAIEAGTIAFNGQDFDFAIAYRVNGGEMQFINCNDEKKEITVNAGDKVALYNDKCCSSGNIICSADCYVYGNIMSLVAYANFVGLDKLENGTTFYNLFGKNTHLKNHPSRQLILPATTLAQNCYAYMFVGCTGLTKAPELPATKLEKLCYRNMFSGCTGLTEAPELPATTLADSCYNHMFWGCTGLTKAPELPATTLAQECYLFMFQGCTGLTKAPELPATTLAQQCYRGMFVGCTGLTKAPELPATTLAQECYRHMFSGCTGLTEAPKLPATRLAYDCYNSMFEGCTNLSSVTCLAATNVLGRWSTTNWLKGVSATGTFYKHPDMKDWETGPSGIPEGWTVVDYDMTGISATTAGAKKAAATTYDLRGMKSTAGKRGLKVKKGRKIMTK